MENKELNELKAELIKRIEALDGLRVVAMKGEIDVEGVSRLSWRIGEIRMVLKSIERLMGKLK